jgi:site-specific DNA-methyltransferase (adenine-specific)
VAKASKRDRNEGLDGLEEQRHSDREKDDGVGGDNPRNRTNAAKQNFHPTVKPTDLMRQLVRLVTPPGGVVLDPFTGSGSTGKAAILEGFEFIGCELTEEYLPIIEGRLNHAVATVKAEQEKEKEKLF